MDSFLEYFKRTAQYKSMRRDAIKKHWHYEGILGLRKEDGSVLVYIPNEPDYVYVQFQHELALEEVIGRSDYGWLTKIHKDRLDGVVPPHMLKFGLPVYIKNDRQIYMDVPEKLGLDYNDYLNNDYVGG